MSVIATNVVQELRIMYIIVGFESYKMTSKLGTQALGRMNDLVVCSSEIQCLMIFMIVDINNYDILLCLD
jgi:hypothetical protein